MEAINVQANFTSGVTVTLKKDAQNNLYLSLTGAPLAAVLTAANLTSLDLAAAPADLTKLAMLISYTKNAVPVLS
jgi:hypothetical protein